MKKLITVIGIMLLICSMMYATVLGSKSLLVVLDLTNLDQMATASAGITFQRPVLELISKDYDNNAGPRLVIQPKNLDVLAIKQTLYIWYYVNALEGQCDITFTPSSFKGDEGYLGYTLTSIEPPILGVNYEGTVPVFNDHIVSPYYGSSLVGEIITSNDRGVSRGYATYELEVDISSGAAAEYSSTWTVQITAI